MPRVQHKDTNIGKDRKCANPTCEKSLAGKRKDAKFCSDSCRYVGWVNDGNAGSQSTDDPGSRRVEANGYISVLTENGWKLEHREIMKKMLGRELVVGETVHHKDGNRHNNLEDNLELWISSHRTGVRASDLKCPHCGEPYLQIIHPRGKIVEGGL